MKDGDCIDSMGDMPKDSRELNGRSKVEKGETEGEAIGRKKYQVSHFGQIF